MSHYAHHVRILNADRTRFTTAGFGTLRGPGITGLRPGDIVAVTDDGDIVQAEALFVLVDEIDLRLRWDLTTHPNPSAMTGPSSEPSREAPALSVPLHHVIKELGFDPAAFEAPDRERSQPPPEPPAGQLQV